MPKYPKFSRNYFYLLLLLLVPLLQLGDRTYSKNYFPLDLNILQFLEQRQNPWLNLVFTSVYRLSNTYVTGAIVLFALIALVRLRYWSEVKGLVFATLGILLMVDEVLKPFFDRDRPPKPRLVSDLSPDSFPSGHGAGNLVFYFYMSFVIAAKYPKYAKYAYGVSTLLVLSIGFSGVYTKAHWATDILAGYMFGYCWLLISLMLLRFLVRREDKIR